MIVGYMMQIMSRSDVVVTWSEENQNFKFTTKSNQPNPSMHPNPPSRPDLIPARKITWLLKLGSRIDRQLEADSSRPMILRKIFTTSVLHSANIALNFVNFHLRLVFICTWTWWCWQHLAGLGRWRGTQAQSCLRHSPTGSPSRTCSSASFKANCSQTTQWAARLKHAHQHLFEKQSSSQSLKNECGKNHLTTICLGLTNAAPVNSKQWLLLACLQCNCLSSQSSQFLDAIASPSSYPVSRWISDPLIFQTWKAPWALESAAV